MASRALTLTTNLIYTLKKKGFNLLYIWGVFITIGEPVVMKRPYILLIIIIYILKNLDIGRLYYYRGASSGRDTLYFANYLYLKNFP